MGVVLRLKYLFPEAQFAELTGVGNSLNFNIDSFRAVWHFDKTRE